MKNHGTPGGKDRRRQHFAYDRPRDHPGPRGICGKFLFYSASEARTAARKLEDSGQCKHKDVGLMEYYCGRCDGYHVGRKSTEDCRGRTQG